MTFRVLDALPLLVEQCGPTVNKVPPGFEREGLENRKVMGFAVASKKVLALDVYKANLDRVRLWIEPPFLKAIAGVSVLPGKKCADLNRPELSSLSGGKGVYLEVSSRPALQRLLAWYS